MVRGSPKKGEKNCSFLKFSRPVLFKWIKNKVRKDVKPAKKLFVPLLTNAYHFIFNC